ncbi:hypothetical protein J4446_00295 [Candidatus Woesearchaeota archaeon]|nr:hypothetical protein [Candidatus Woesearchaeota archaeon]
MKKGQGTGLALIVSTIILILIITFYVIILVLIPGKSIEIKSEQYIGSESDINLINFVNLNSDLIVKSVSSYDYTELEKEIYKSNIDECWEMKINEKRFSNNCEIKNPYTTEMNIPDYEGHTIKIIFTTNSKYEIKKFEGFSGGEFGGGAGGTL